MVYNDAAAAFGNKQLDAFWLFTAFPSGAVIMAAQTNDIGLIDLVAWARNSGFFEKVSLFHQALGLCRDLPWSGLRGSFVPGLDPLDGKFRDSRGSRL